MNLSVGAKTDPGRRPNNEDQLLVLDVKRHHLRADGVLVIADGMGGRNFGERASGAAVETVGDTLTEMLDAERDPHVDVGDALDSALRKANSRVYELAGSDEESKGMGTTCVAAVVEGDRVFVAHAGDSRAYLWRKGQLQRLTDDHSYVAEQVKAGVLTEESARRSRFRNVITRAVGIEPTITPDVSHYDVLAGDTLLLCTDGLSNMVSEDEIAQTLGQAATAQAAADRLVHLANLNGGRDNITAIVARMEVGTRTQRMRANDLAQIAKPEDPVETEAEEVPAENQNGSRQPAPTPVTSVVDETPTVQPARRPAPAPVPQTQDDEDESEYEDEPPTERRGLRRLRIFGVSLLFLIAALGVAATLYLGQFLIHIGYHFQTAAPFAVKPPPPLPPRPPDLSHLTYGTPTLVGTVPVAGDTLTRSPIDGSLTVVALSGTVLVLDSDGGMRYKYPMPSRHMTAGATPDAGDTAGTGGAATPAPLQRLHTATDPQGNFYVSDSTLHSIEKYSPNGEYLQVVAQGPKVLKMPQALAVGKDGTVYVVDAQRLKSIPATPQKPK